MIISFLKPALVIFISIVSAIDISLAPIQTANSLACRVNDVTWQSEEHDGNPFDSTVPTYAIVHNNNISIYAENGTSLIGEKVIIQFKVDSLNASASNTTDLSAILKRNGDYYSLDNPEKSQVHISSWDKEKGVLKGLFSFSVKNLDGEKLTLSEGEFFIKY